MLFRAAFACLLLPAGVVAHQETGAIRWPDEAKKHLNRTQRDVLVRQKFVVGDQGFKQVFTPYLNGDLPAFVTADSVLNAFHVLLEESVYRLERVNAGRLPAFLEHVARRLDKATEGLAAEPVLLSAARKRALVFLGTALRLHKEDAGTFDEATAKLIGVEVARVTAARGAVKPGWLGPRDKGFVAIDYTRFRPRGFYTRSTELQRHFRVVSWLQAIPFRVQKDEELLAALILSRAAVVPDGAKFAAVRQGRAVLDTFNDFLGSGDDWGLAVLEAYHTDIDRFPRDNKAGNGMAKWLRGQLLKRARGDGRPQINDQLAFIPDDPRAHAEVSIRMAPAYRLPDAVLFQRTTDPRVINRAWPSGLDVAAVLGSALARRHLAKTGGEELLALIDINKKALFHTSWDDEDDWARARDTSSLYQQYLACLGNLVSNTEADWPAFMKGEAWQAKTCQTALAGWAQMRHTWVLQAKANIEWMGASRKPTGFVEPVPEFYRKLGRLCERCRHVLDGAGAFADDARAVSRDEFYELSFYDELIQLLERTDVAKKGAEAYKQLSNNERKTVCTLAELLGQSDPGRLQQPNQFSAYLAGLRKERDQRARKIDVALGDRWKVLRDCCARLECLSHKQLRGREFAGEEKAFLKHYGAKLGWLMFYEGNSYQTPRDDAPRVVDVFTGPARPRHVNEFLEVGISKPRAIYVLYPWQGTEVLCRGAVLPYHEFVHRERLTDEAWRRLLSGKAQPAPPTWAGVLTDRKDGK